MFEGLGPYVQQIFRWPPRLRRVDATVLATSSSTVVRPLYNLCRIFSLRVVADLMLANNNMKSATAISRIKTTRYTQTRLLRA